MREFSEKQRRLVTWWLDACGKDGVIAEGAVRSGKTWAMIFGFLLWSQANFSNRQFIVAGRTMGSLTRNVVMPMVDMLANVFRWPYSYNRGIGSITVGTNVYHLFGASSEQSQDVLQGMTAAGAMLDEVALMPRSFVDQSIARCSVEGSLFWWNCNPSTPSHFVKKDFIDKAEEKRFEVIRFTMEDNPSLSAEMRERYHRMYSGVFYDRYVRGLWVVAEGLVYQDFDEVSMVKELSAERARALPKYVSIDYGITNPFVAIEWAIDGGRAYALREYCFDSREEGRRRTDEEHYSALNEWIGEEYVETIVIDPSANSFKECIARHGDYDYRNANNAVNDGIAKTSTAMNAGCLFIGAGCKTLLSEIGLYRWDEKKAREQVVKENDHACDAMRYFVATVGVRELRCFDF